MVGSNRNAHRQLWKRSIGTGRLFLYAIQIPAFVESISRSLGQSRGTWSAAVMDCKQQMANRYQDAASSSRRQYHAGGRRAACDRPETLQSPLLSPGSACSIVLHRLDYMAHRAET